MRPLALIVAMTEARVIGANGKLPWSLPEDMAHFKATTMWRTVIMGRSTHESIGRPLIGRMNIVMSRKRGAQFAGCNSATSLRDALAIAHAHCAEPFVIGGASVYVDALPLATRIVLTLVPGTYAGDAYFPELDPAEWREVSSRQGDSATFKELERV